MDQSVYQPIAAPGYFLPHCRIENQKSIYDVLSSKSWTLIISDERANVNVKQLEKKFVNSHLTLEILPLQKEMYPFKYILIRPDWHIVYSGNELNNGYFECFLKKFF